MNTVLLCDKALPALFALQGEMPIAQLPVLDKTIAEYHLELLCQDLQPDKVTLIAGHYQDTLETRLGRGCRWGVELMYQKTLMLNQELPVLVMPCDRLSSFDLTEFTQQLADHPEQSAVGLAGQTPVVYWITQRDDWRELISGVSPSNSWRIQLSEAVSRPVTSIGDFFDINLGLLRNEFPKASIKAFPHGDHLLLAVRAQVSDTASIQGRSYIGNTSSIGKYSSLNGHCAVQQQVMVDQRARLEDCVILPNSYIGSGMSIKNALVSGSFIWHRDTGACLRVKEMFLLSEVPGRRLNGLFGSRRRQGLGRLGWVEA